MIGEVWMVSLSEVYGWVGDASMGDGLMGNGLIHGIWVMLGGIRWMGGRRWMGFDKWGG